MSLSELLSDISYILKVYNTINKRTFFNLDLSKKTIYFNTQQDTGYESKIQIDKDKDIPFDLNSPISFKKYAKFASSIFLEQSNITTTQTIPPPVMRQVCYSWNIKVQYYLLNQKFAQKKLIVKPDPCGLIPNTSLYLDLYSEFFVYISQQAVSIYQFLVCVRKIAQIYQTVLSIQLKAKGQSNEYVPLEIDYNIYRYLRHSPLIDFDIPDKKIADMPLLSLSYRLLRPMFYCCFIGYIIQITSAIYNILVLFENNEIEFNQRLLASLAVFFAWMDCYTISSKKKETGVQSLTLAAAIKRIISFSVGVVIVFIAFSLFASVLYQNQENFSNVGVSMITIFSIGFGDAIRYNMMEINNDPFSQIFAITTIGMFYLCLSQVYVGIFMLKYEKRLKASKFFLDNIKDCENESLMGGESVKAQIDFTKVNSPIRSNTHMENQANKFSGKDSFFW